MLYTLREIAWRRHWWYITYPSISKCNIWLSP